MSRRSLRSGLPGFTAGACLLLVWPAPSAAVAAAQSPAPPSSEARIQGVVVRNAENEPVADASVTIVGTDVSVRTDWLGTFALPSVPVGNVSVRVSAPGHPSVVQDVFVRDDRVVFLRVELATLAAVLDEMIVETSRPLDVYQARARTAADLLAREVPSLLAGRGEVGKNDYGISLRAATSLTTNSAPVVLIDGIIVSRIEDALAVLDRIPAADVAEIEVLKGPTAAFLFPFAANGVVSVRTKSGGIR